MITILISYITASGNAPAEGVSFVNFLFLALFVILVVLVIKSLLSAFVNALTSSRKSPTHIASIPIKPGSKNVVVIDQKFISFNNWKIDVNHVTGLAFGSCSNHSLVSSRGTDIVIHTASNCYKISASSISMFGNFKGKDNMEQIVHAVCGVLRPVLFKKILGYIFANQLPVDIGKFTLTDRDLTYRGLTGRKSISWKMKPGVNPTHKYNILKMAHVYGLEEVYYFNSQKGKNEILGHTSSSDVNGFLMGMILEWVRSRN